jgi:hypothetical protein
MAKVLYCWRCKADIPMLEEQEWEEVLPALMRGIDQIKRYRQTHGVSLAAAKQSLAEAKDEIYGRGALAKYFEITGYRETNVKAIWHHRVSSFGPPCRRCGKPLRTPQAKMCAQRGAAR